MARPRGVGIAGAGACVMASQRGAGIFRPDVTDDLEVPGHVVQHLGDVFAELGHPSTAIGTGARTVIGRLMHNLLPRQMIGQRLTLWLAALADCSRGSASATSASARAAASAMPDSSSSSRSSSWAIWRLIRSEDRPNCMRRNLAIWNLSFSISRALY